MLGVSDQFKAALAQPHKMICRVDILDNGMVKLQLPVTDGRVTVDAESAVHRSASVTCVDETGTLTPSNAGDLLMPFGNEMRVYRGIQFLDSSQELVLLGTFVMWEVDIQDSKEGVVITIDGYDRAKLISENSWVDPYKIAANTNYVDAISGILGDRYPNINVYANPSTYVTTAQTLGDREGADPWQDALDMATDIGDQLYMSVDGDAILLPWPDLLVGDAVWNYFEGEDATFTKVGAHYSREDGYNIAVVTGEGSNITSPPRAVIEDLDPHSPTYVMGKYGKRPKFYSSSSITTQQQATDAATGLLRRHSGVSQSVTFDTVVNPAHEAGDIIQISRARSKIEDRYVISTLDIPLNKTQPMTAKCRLKQVVT